MSDFKVNVTAELDTSKLKSALNKSYPIKISDVVIPDGTLNKIKSAIESAGNKTKLKVNIDTKYLQSQISSALKELNASTGKSGNSSVSNYTKQLESLEKQYNSFLTRFNKANGQGFSGFSELRAGIEELDTAIQTLKADSAGDVINASELKKGVQEQKAALESLKNEFTAINTAVKQFETGQIDKEISNITSSISKMGGALNTELTSKISGSMTEIRELKTALADAIEVGDTKAITTTFAQLQAALAKVKNGISEVKAAQGGNWIDTSQIEDLIRKVQKLEGVDISGIMSKLKAGLDAGAISPGDWSAITSEFKDLQAQASNVGSTAQTAGSSIKSMFAAFTAGISAVTIIHKVNSAIKDMVGNVHAVDDAMTELKKVTNETDSAYSSYLKNSASTAKELGTTISDYVNSTADFARLGNSFTDSQELAKVASVYNIVGDDLSGIDQATEHIISSMYAFGVEASNAISIVDKLNEVSKSVAEKYGNVLGLSLQGTISVKGLRKFRPRKGL